MEGLEYFCSVNGVVYAQNHEEGLELPVLVFDEISNMRKRYLYRVVYDGEFKDDSGQVLRDERGETIRRKLWQLVK